MINILGLLNKLKPCKRYTEVFEQNSAIILQFNPYFIGSTTPATTLQPSPPHTQFESR